MQKEAGLDFGAIKRTVPLADVLSRYGVLDTLKGRGSKRRGPCPIHGGRNAEQFHVDLTRSLWVCFGDCKGGGSVIDFVAAMEGTSVREAARTLSTWFGVSERPGSTQRR
jgi:DNA primase